MKKEAPVGLIIVGVVILLAIVIGFGYRTLNPPQILRDGGPTAMPQREPGTARSGKPAMAAQPGAGDFTK